MLNLITQWLNGPHAGATMLTLRIAFFAAFVTAALWLALGGARKAGKNFTLLAIAGSLALLAIFSYQTTWQLFGARRVAFMRFTRSHNPRPGAPISRGAIEDWRGEPLALNDPLPGEPLRRRYPLGAAAVHVVGYFDPRYGMAGMERAADLPLSGYGGTTLEELDRLRRNLMTANKTSGENLRLTLDARLQRKAYALMEGRQGAVVALSPQDGTIKVLLSVPGFDPQRPGAAHNDSAQAPMLNRALQGLYPPGSTFKIVMAALAAEQRIAPRFDCPGSGFRAARDAQPIRDSEYYIRQREGRVWGGHGVIGLRDGFVHSSNVYFAQLGLACQADAFNALVERTLIRERVVLYRAPDGTIASLGGALPRVTSEDRRMRTQLAIGQGSMVVTPLHVTLWSAVVANRGALAWPHLEATAAPRAAQPVISRAAAATVSGLMREAVLHGTGRAADIPGLEVCGKTGTAQAPGGADHAWFTCFAPASSPKLVVTVLVERGGYGSRAALPVARALLEEAAALNLLQRGGGKP